MQQKVFTVSKRKYIEMLTEALIFFVLSVFATHFASIFATIKASNSVDDIILSNVPVFDFEFFFVNVAIALFIFVVVLCFRFPKSAPFLIKTSALFIIVRSMFVSLTHIGPFPTRLELDSTLLNFITSGNDLFFSGHTGLPFLIALIFWDHVYIRYIFLFFSILFGIVVLLAHLHYSIDVFAAFFITYSIYHIAIRVFVSDYSLFLTHKYKK